MKTQSSDFFSILLVLVIGLLLTVSADAFPQHPPVLPEGSTVPSPLSALDGTFEPPEYYSSTIPVTQLVTHQIDLREVLLAYSAEHKCSMNAAFLELETRLRMKPLGTVPTSNPTQQAPSHNAVYKLVGNDVYAISAKQVFFNSLQFELSQFRYGDKQIVVQVRFFQIPKDDVVTLQSFMIPGTFETFGNRLPVVETIAANGTFASQRNAATGTTNDTLKNGESKSGTFVLATETRTKAYPTFIGHLDQRGVKQILQFSKSRSSMNITQAPTVTMFAGQRATVNDGALRPFVVSVNKVTDGITTAHQPVIQLLEDGTKIAIQADELAGKIKLSGDLAFSKVLGVETFEYPFSKDANGNTVTIQVPEHRIRKVHWSAEVDSNNSILIDSVETFEKEIKPKTRFKAAVTKSMRTLIMITPTLIDQAEVAERETIPSVTR